MEHSKGEHKQGRSPVSGHNIIVGDQMDKAIKSVYETVKARDPNQPEFHQAVEEVLDSLGPVISENPEYIDVVQGMVEPERVIQFRVPWYDDEGNLHVNRGIRVQFNSAIGPYKGGLRFHPSAVSYTHLTLPTNREV